MTTTGVSQISTIAPDGTGLVQVTAASSQTEERPGSRIGFDRNVSGVTHIFTIAVAGGNELAGLAGAPIDPAF